MSNSVFAYILYNLLTRFSLFNVIIKTLVGGVLLLSRDAVVRVFYSLRQWACVCVCVVGVFDSPSQLSQAMKGQSTFTKAAVLLEPHHQFV